MRKCLYPYLKWNLWCEYQQPISGTSKHETGKGERDLPLCPLFSGREHTYKPWSWKSVSFTQPHFSSSSAPVSTPVFTITFFFWFSFFIYFLILWVSLYYCHTRHPGLPIFTCNLFILFHLSFILSFSLLLIFPVWDSLHTSLRSQWAVKSHEKHDRWSSATLLELKTYLIQFSA